MFVIEGSRSHPAAAKKCTTRKISLRQKKYGTYQNREKHSSVRNKSMKDSAWIILNRAENGNPVFKETMEVHAIRLWTCKRELTQPYPVDINPPWTVMWSGRVAHWTACAYFLNIFPQFPIFFRPTFPPQALVLASTIVAAFSFLNNLLWLLKFPSGTSCHLSIWNQNYYRWLPWFSLPVPLWIPFPAFDSACFPPPITAVSFSVNLMEEVSCCSRSTWPNRSLAG